VYGKLLTADAVSPLHTWPVVGSLSLFVAVYGSLVGAYIYYVVRVVRQGPEGPDGAEDPDAGRVLVPSHPAVAGRREAT
jgi:cytochrome d ubiquinol oxidase subunit I